MLPVLSHMLTVQAKGNMDGEVLENLKARLEQWLRSSRKSSLKWKKLTLLMQALLMIKVTVIINQLMRRPDQDWLSGTSLLFPPALHHLPHLPHRNVLAGWWDLLAYVFQIQARVSLAFWVTEIRFGRPNPFIPSPTSSILGSGNTVAQWLAMLPDSMKVAGSSPSWASRHFWAAFTCSPCVCVGFLQKPKDRCGFQSV
ncbi:uncharacterized protein isoform X2 [Danio rerio]|uniref:Uncharacterized protein isoform X2 n=1 Tax=Danio rerio TaxID=7955 RepID=A0AC58G9T5_DANRE